MGSSELTSVQLITMAVEVLFFALLLAGACASPVGPSVSADFHFDLPDIKNFTAGGFKITSHGASIDVKDFTLMLASASPSHAEATFSVRHGGRALHCLWRRQHRPNRGRWQYQFQDIPNHEHDLHSIQ